MGGLSKMRKWIIYILIMLLFLPIILASNEVQISCGGNEEVQINCLNGQELSFWGSLPVISPEGSSWEGMIKPIPTTIFRKIFNYTYIIFIVIILFIFFLFFFYKRRKKKEN